MYLWIYNVQNAVTSRVRQVIESDIEHENATNEPEVVREDDNCTPTPPQAVELPEEEIDQVHERYKYTVVNHVSQGRLKLVPRKSFLSSIFLDFYKKFRRFFTKSLVFKPFQLLKVKNTI